MWVDKACMQNLVQVRTDIQNKGEEVLAYLAETVELVSFYVVVHTIDPEINPWYLQN